MTLLTEEYRDQIAAINNVKNQINQTELNIKKLGPDLQPTMEEKEAEERQKIERGGGNFETLNQLIGSVAAARQAAKDRAALWSKWESLRRTLNKLEADLEEYRINQGTHRGLTTGR